MLQHHLEANRKKTFSGMHTKCWGGEVQEWVRELEPILHQMHDRPHQPIQRGHLLRQHWPCLGRHLPRNLPWGMDRRHVLCAGLTSYKIGSQPPGNVVCWWLTFYFRMLIPSGTGSTLSCLLSLAPSSWLTSALWSLPPSSGVFIHNRVVVESKKQRIWST